RRPVVVDSPRLIYMVPGPAITARAARKPGSVAVSPRVFRFMTTDSATFTSVRPRDFATVPIVSGGRAPPTIEEGELAAALDREFLLGGDPMRVEAPQRESLTGLAQILGARPFARLRVVGFGPNGPDGALGARPGFREAEAFARELVAL